MNETSDMKQTGVMNAPRRRVVARAWLAWSIGAGAMVFALLTVAPFEGLAWHVVSNFRVHAMVVSVCAGVIALLCGRWRAGVPGLMGLVSVLPFVVSSGGARAQRAMDPSEHGVRVLHFNVFSYNERLDEVMGLMEGSGADVIAIIESPKPLTEILRHDPERLAEWPHRFIPPEPFAGLKIILSRWPLRHGEEWTGLPDFVRGNRLPSALIEAPGGDFILAQSHPYSPRTSVQMREGDALLRDHLTLLKSSARRFGVPIVIAADMNGTPSSRRGRLVSATTGHRASGGVLGFLGTWPAGLPAPLRLAIDDVWVPDGVLVAGRRVLGATGSDHAPVLVDLVLPRVRVGSSAERPASSEHEGEP